MVARKPIVDASKNSDGRLAKNSKDVDDNSSCDLWIMFAYTVTWWAFPSCLSACGKKDLETQRAWREKIVRYLLVSCDL